MPDQYNLPPPSDTEKIWTALGLSPQTFPIYYPMGAQPFLGGNGQPSGASGATARLTRDLSNFPHMFMGLRISNVYALGDDPSADDVQQFRVMHEWLDGEQAVTINLAQQNITAERLIQTQLCGRGGEFWHPFPAPFPMAGANNISVEITRLTSYPQLGGVSVTPTCHVSILAAVMRGGMKTAPPTRVEQPY